ncbi:alpha/beta hydrolase [Curtobacterium sp. RRHDQ10]|uniref:alpha/beta hydrolase n=1 Tax=Curtobacterium phyllosphaerae TaxID=3413379 RepID=UPI003BF081E0
MTYWQDETAPAGRPVARAVRLRVWIALAVTLGIVLGLVAGASSVGRLVPHALLQAYTAPIDWQRCGDFRCASVEAPLDWSDAGTASIHLALIEHRATERREGALLVNPGGPGGSGVDMVGSGVENAVTPDVAKHFDVVGFDPRGVGYSSRVRCGGAAELDRFLYPDLPGRIGSAAWLAADRKVADRFAAACAEHTGALLGHVDTTSAARDLELLRADLGESKLNYLGYSYGTALGSVYAGLYPGHVGRFVLDGAEDLWSESSEAASDSQAGAFEGDLRAWMRACLAGEDRAVGSGTCPFSGSMDGAMDRLRTLLADTEAHPLVTAGGRELTGAVLATAIATPLYRTSEWPSLTTMLAATLHGDPTKAFRLADQYNGRRSNGTYMDNQNEAFTAIGCLDYGSDDDLADMRADARALAKAAPVLGPYQAYSGVTCGAWKYGPVDYPEPVTAPGADPIIVVGTTGDPATPYADAKSLAARLDSGHLITKVGQGHTAYDLGDECVDDSVDAYLLHGTVPADHLRCR